MVGDEHLPKAEIVVLDINANNVVYAKCPPLISPVFSPFQRHRIWWSADSRTVYLLDQERDCKTLRLIAVDAQSGESRIVIEERGETPLDFNLSEYLFMLPNVRDLETGEIVWFSERYGWGHLYTVSYTHLRAHET